MARWTAQWGADDCRQCRSSSIGGNARWMAAVIMMDVGGVIVIDGGRSDGQQQQHKGQRDGRAIAMGNEMGVA
jgi:hypothetical protein